MHTWWRRARLWACLAITLGLVPACGKKGPPLAPLPRIPAAVGEFSALRRHDTVLLGLVVPSANVGGDVPADVAAIEVFAVTGGDPPEPTSGPMPPGLTRVSTTRVRRPLPPVPAEEAAAVPPIPREPGVADQGERLTIAEPLTEDVRRPIASAGPAAVAATDPVQVVPPPVFMSATQGVRRHYVAVAVSRGGRRSPWSPVKSVPMADGPAPPRDPTPTYDEQAVTVTWTPGPGATVAPSAAADGLLESRPLGPVSPPTRYNVYAAAPNGAPADASSAVAPLNTELLATTTWSASGVTFGQERCFAVRAVDTVDGVDIEGAASVPACVTPRDTFPPAAPAALDAVGGLGVVSLIWDRVEQPDVVGYLVFRGPATGDAGTQLTPEPIVASSFEDRTVTPGVRYAYVVVAVDSATPPNRSAPSNRAEGVARQ